MNTLKDEKRRFGNEQTRFSLECQNQNKSDNQAGYKINRQTIYQLYLGTSMLVSWFSVVVSCVKVGVHDCDSVDDMSVGKERYRARV